MAGNQTAAGAQAPADADTFPKLLRWHASVRGRRPAMRHKDRGIWITWTWSEVRELTLLMAHGFRKLGINRGDRIAIAGANRPRLYWAVTAAQTLGAIPVPVYADAVAVELALAGAGKITVVNRSPARGGELVNVLRGQTSCAAWSQTVKTKSRVGASGAANSFQLLLRSVSVARSCLSSRARARG